MVICFYAIGYTNGGTQIQGFKSVGLNNFAYNANVNLVHNTFIYVTAVASNVAGLHGISYSEPVLVDLTPPDIVNVYDGDILSKIYNKYIVFIIYDFISDSKSNRLFSIFSSISDVDQEAWTNNEVSVNFKAFDKESGIDHCEWAIGMFCFHSSTNDHICHIISQF